MVSEKYNYNELETKIVNAASKLFIERGFAGTNMSDIASRAGINRPTLHYYFHTKEKMFNAVFGAIVTKLIPRVKNIILQAEIPINERISSVIDAYYEVFTTNPDLPLFIIREMHRDFNGFTNTVQELGLAGYFKSIKKGLQKEMEANQLRKVPTRYLFMTFYSMLTMPFITSNLCRSELLNGKESFEDLLSEWEPYIIYTMTQILCAKNNQS